MLFQIQVTPMRLFSEEQEDGEERPDLDFGLTVSCLLSEGELVLGGGMAILYRRG